jgi:hypothetical protein
MKRMLMLGLLAATAIVSGAACSSGGDEAAPDSQNGALAIDPATEDPAKILPADFVSTLQAVISPEDVHQSFGLDDSRIPYPDTFWPFKFVDQDSNQVLAKNGVDDRWLDADQPSPLEKYMALLDDAHVADAKKWEADNHGENVAGVQSWFGHCPGWTAAAMVNAPLQHGVSVKKDSSGQLVKCAEGDDSCTTFEIGDLNGLEAEVFVDSNSTFLGSRCDTKPRNIPRDTNGRILKPGCRGMNPGSVIVILANRMKNVKKVDGFVPKAIAIDAQNQFNTDQIWNQPAYRYEVNDARALTEAEAIAATSTKTGAALPTKYPFNPAAKGWFRVDIGIKWVQENGPNREMVSGKLSTQTMRFAAVLELDGDPAAPATRIIGGEFVDDPTSGANRLTVPPFMWTADGPGPETTTNHNPFVKSSAVQQLVQLALED